MIAMASHVGSGTVTSDVLSGEENNARAAGCDDYVPEPSAHDNCWRRFSSICLNSRDQLLHRAMSAFGTKWTSRPC